MTVVFVVLAAMVVLGLALVLAGTLDSGLRGPDRPGAPALPQQPWTATDVRGISFRVALRGYRMQDVDAMLAELAAEIESREDLSADTAAAESLDVATSESPPDGPANSSAG